MKLIPVTLFVIMFLSACTNTALFFANSLARFGDYTVHRNIPYGVTKEQRLDVYLPSSLAESAKPDIATVIFFYGGCWGACSNLTKGDYQFVAEALAVNNVAVVIVDYRQFPDVLFPDIMDDAKHAVEWVSENIQSYGVPSNHLFLMGHSSGAHIASMLTFNEDYLHPKAYANIEGFIGLAGPYDFLPFDEPYQPALFAPPESYAQSQTINYVDGNEPPALLLYGNDDQRVKRRNIISLSTEIKKQNGKVEVHFYDETDHVDLIGTFSIPWRSSKPIVDDVLSFVSSQRKQ
ncbi:MAG: alpha/beta hydrolase [Ectothiorhodospiraceae bacterium]|nr:alpha/beta hydrolase [Ectothiorhodospiraceae bacterium]